MGLIARIAPRWALKRALARRQLQLVNARLEAGEPSRTNPRRGDSGSGDATTARAGDSVRTSARYLDDNHDLAIGVIEDLISNVIGEGISIEQMSVLQDGLPAEAFNREVDKAWREWTATADSSTQLPWGEMQRLICRSLFRDGEVLIQHVIGRGYPYQGPIPYVLEAVEADYLPFDLTEPARQGRPRIIQGVELNDWRMPVAYHIFKEHPGDRGSFHMARLGARAGTKRVPGDRIVHLKTVRRLGQTRGVSLLAGVMRRLEDVKDYEESERIAARANAEIAGIIRNTPGLGSDSGNLNESMQEWRMESGMWLTQVQGEDIDMIQPTRPNSALADFRSSQLRAVAAGTSTRYSAIARDFGGSYSSQRQELVEGRIGYTKLRNYIIGRFYWPVRQRFIDLAILANVLTVPDNLDRRTLYNADYRGPAMPWIDPQKENDARVDAVDAGFMSRYQVIRDMGNDPDVVDAQRARDPMNSQAQSNREAQPPEQTELQVVR